MELTNKKISVSQDGKMVWVSQYHVIFCTKYKRNVFSKEIRERLGKIIYETAEKFKFKVLELSIFESYVHILLNVSPKLDVYKMVLRIKSEAQVLLKEFPELNSRLPCLWSGANFIYAVGDIELDEINKFLEEQRGK